MEDAGNTPIGRTNAFFVQRRGEDDLDFLFTGHVPTTATTVPLITGFNFVNRTVPTPITLG